MTMEIMFESSERSGARLVVVGVGGGGGNAVNNMVEAGLAGVEFIAANTDIQALDKNLATTNLQLGKESTRGLGAGANPDVGREAALEDREKIKELLAGSDMVFITAGMGGGTGTGAAPIVAEIAKEVNALTVAVVTTPFSFEGPLRMSRAQKGMEELTKAVDTLIHIPNNRLRTIAPKGATFFDMLKQADTVLRDAVQGISDLIVKPGLINLDFANVRTVMRDMGRAMMGTGQAGGDNRTMKAMELAINNPLLNEININGARSVLMNVTAPSNITIDELEDASNQVRELVHEEANIIWGCVQDDSLGDDVRITIIATGMHAAAAEVVAPRRLMVGGGGPVIGGGGLDPDTDMFTLNQVPAYARNKGRGPGGGGQRPEPSLDIPTFLRRKAD